MSRKIQDRAVIEALDAGRFKIDLNTDLENFFVFGFYLSFTAFSVFFVVFFYTFLIFIPKFYFLYYIGLSALITFSFHEFRKNTDNYYIVDAPGRRLLYHFKFYGIVKVHPVLSFDDISCVSVNGYRYQQRRWAVWQYRLAAVSRGGSLIELSDEFDEDAISPNNQKAKELAGIFGCDFIEGGREKIIHVTSAADGSAAVTCREYSPTGGAKVQRIKIEVVAPLLMIFFVIDLSFLFMMITYASFEFINLFTFMFIEIVAVFWFLVIFGAYFKFRITR